MADEPLSRLRRWVLYYGATRPAGLSGYDLAVVAPEGWDPPSLRLLQARGTQVLAYLSVLEVPRRPGFAPPVNVLKADGTPVAREAWNTWVLDPRHAQTRSRLLHLANALALQGYDGFFLDTVGDVEDHQLPLRVRSLLLPATAALVAALRERYPRHILTQNWGLGALLDLTRPSIDAVCWEDFPLGYPEPWQEELALRLRRMAEGGLTVLALSHERREEPPDLAVRLGFPWYGAPGSYTEWGGGSAP